MKFTRFSDTELLRELGSTRTWLDTHVRSDDHDHDAWCFCPSRAQTIQKARWRLMALIYEWCGRHGEPMDVPPFEVLDGLGMLADPERGPEFVNDAQFVLLVHRLTDVSLCRVCLPTGCTNRAVAEFILVHSPGAVS